MDLRWPVAALSARGWYCNIREYRRLLGARKCLLIFGPLHRPVNRTGKAPETSCYSFAGACLFGGNDENLGVAPRQV
jgi:hypothetical protein